MLLLWMIPDYGCPFFELEDSLFFWRLILEKGFKDSSKYYKSSIFDSLILISTLLIFQLAVSFYFLALSNSSSSSFLLYSSIIASESVWPLDDYLALLLRDDLSCTDGKILLIDGILGWRFSEIFIIKFSARNHFYQKFDLWLLIKK